MQTFSIPYAGETKIQIGATYGYSNPKSNKIALITGITGQDGSYLAEWLLHNNYEVHGIVRRASTDNLSRIKHIQDKLILHEGDITDPQFVYRLFYDTNFIEIYNLAAQSHVKTSFGTSYYTFQVNTIGLLNVLESIKHCNWHDDLRIYQASTSEMFGNSTRHMQGIDTPFDPQSPYAIAKLAAHELIKVYRESYGLYAVSGILFNHESPRRGEKFVTRKITKYFASPMLRSDEKLKLGNINAIRDWGFAPDYVKVMHDSLQQPEPKDFVLGTGQTLTVEQFITIAARYAGIENWKDYVEYDAPEFLRPSDVNYLHAKSDYQVKTQVKDLIRMMIDYDRGVYGRGDGYKYYMDNYGDVFAWRI